MGPSDTEESVRRGVRAWVIDQRFGLDALTLVDRSRRPLGPREVRVRVDAVSLNYRDLMVVRGEYNPKQRLPLVPCSDGAGEVIEVGAGTDAPLWNVGDKVVTSFCQGWQSGALTREKALSSLGSPGDGVLAEEVVLRDDGLVAAPRGMSSAEAATLPCAAVTAWSALVEQGRVRAGDTVLVQGTGGVALFALQIASMHGAKVCVVSRSAEKLARTVALGAAQTIHAPDGQWARAAREWTGGVGFHHVVDLGGAKTLEQSLKAVRYGGRVSVIGVLSGNRTEVSLLPLLMQNVALQGVYVGSREMLASVVTAFESTGIRPVVDRIFPFADAPAAFRYLESGAHFGKVVIARDAPTSAVR
jgi:NADPH:quinone reductase-like Zn-dependent oxidoreductase